MSQKGAQRGDSAAAPIALVKSDQVRTSRGHTAADSRQSMARHQADRGRVARAHAAGDTPSAIDAAAMSNRTKQIDPEYLRRLPAELLRQHRKGNEK